MLPSTFVRGYDRQRLRNLLLVLFAALAIPTGIIVWQAFDQLKWEAWYQYRTQAESLTNRINASLAAAVADADARRFSDFAFVTASPATNVVQRSPLSVYPVQQDVAGTIGYFQIAPDGQLSTPLLPDDNLQSDTTGLSAQELVVRQAAAGHITQVLADNALVSARSAAAGRTETLLEIEEIVVTANRITAETTEREDRDETPRSFSPGALSSAAEPARSVTLTNSPSDYSLEQSVFDQTVDALKEYDGESMDDVAANASALGKVADIQLDDALERKNETALQRGIEAAPATLADEDSKRRQRRTESAPAPAAPAESLSTSSATAVITTFESEIDPFEFSMLRSGHLVLYRNAWREGARYIQGVLLDREVFLQSVVESGYMNESLADMSDLIVSYEDNVIDLFTNALYDYAMSIDGWEFSGSLLYRSQLVAPFDRLELIYSIDHFPPGPGAKLLGWLTILIAVVFVGGFIALYRLGLGQIRLAQQQQDFVSAVSHELKTPLTSIRMYGEMLKEGWVDEDKRRQYYDYIHDESERLARLISNVLQLAKITRSEPEFNQAPVAVGPLMDQVRSKIASHAERAGFDINLVVDENSIEKSLNIDEDCFTQIVINLVDNAIKFSKDASQKRIDIGARTDRDGNIELSVRDYGPGIPKNQLRKIFQLFYRTETELTRETVGTGIGLAIVHQLTTAMGGSVDVVNADPGARFSIVFPTV